MTSQDTGGAGFPGARAAARSAGRVRSLRWLPASSGRNARGWGLLEEVRVYSTQVGLSCSTHNPWPVDPRPRGVGRPEDGARLGAGLASVPPGPGTGARWGGWGQRCPAPPPRPRGVAPASGPVSTQRASTARRRCAQRGSLEFCDCSSGFDVGVVLMSAPWAPTTHRVSFIDPPSPPGQPPHPGFPPERASQKGGDKTGSAGGLRSQSSSCRR